MDLGLERVGAVYRRLGLARPPTVLTVGGTNGKGSVAAYLDAMLAAAGYECGLFTSPHLIRYHERIRIRGREISDELLMGAFDRIDAARGEISLSFFEWNALAALVAFAHERVDVAVLEVGMGGRLDAVNLMDADVAAVVSVGLDHREWLGDTIEQIGVEKAGIFRAGRPAIFGSRSMPQSVGRAAGDCGARLKRLGVDFDFVERPDGWDYLGLGSRRRELPLPALAGSMQVSNAATALAVLEAAEPALLVPDEAVRAGLARVRLAGRFQVVAVTTSGSWTWPTTPMPRARWPRASRRVRSAAARSRSAASWPTRMSMASSRRSRGRCRSGSWCGSTDRDRCRSPSSQHESHCEPARRYRPPTAWPPVAGCAATVCGEGDRILVFGSFHTVGPALVHLGIAA